MEEIKYDMDDSIPAAEAEDIGEPMDTLDPHALAQALADILDSKKARDIRILNVKGKSEICDYFVLATGTSNTHVHALASELEYKSALRKVPPYRIEGRGRNTWMVLDYTTVMVHIFTREVREFYNLDKLYREDMETVTPGTAEQN